QRGRGRAAAAVLSGADPAWLPPSVGLVGKGKASRNRAAYHHGRRGCRGRRAVQYALAATGAPAGRADGPVPDAFQCGRVVAVHGLCGTFASLHRAVGGAKSNYARPTDRVPEPSAATTRAASPRP